MHTYNIKPIQPIMPSSLNSVSQGVDSANLSDFDTLKLVLPTSYLDKISSNIVLMENLCIALFDNPELSTHLASGTLKIAINAWLDYIFEDHPQNGFPDPEDGEESACESFAEQLIALSKINWDVSYMGQNGDETPPEVKQLMESLATKE